MNCSGAIDASLSYKIYRYQFDRTYKISEQKQYKKYTHQFRGKKKYKQFNLYGKLTKAKFNFDSN